MYYLNQNNELMHYGVPGMKWGKRKKYLNSNGSLNKLGQARKRYEDSKAAYKKDTKDARGGLGIKKIQKSIKAQKSLPKTEMDMISAKAKYNAAKQNTRQKAERAEYKTYLREMRKVGVRGSYNDEKSGGKATRIYNTVAAQKGKQYADKIEKRVQNEAYASLAGATAVVVGQLAITAFMLD